MNEHDQNNLNQLQQRLELLLRRQETLYNDVNGLRATMESFKKSQLANLEQTSNQPSTASVTSAQTTNPDSTAPQSTPSPTVPVEPIATQPVQTQQPISTLHGQNPQNTYYKKAATNSRSTTSKSSLEKFIGENLINKIGIVITVIGVAIGAKYAIENKLISPLTRIILGYLIGIGLLATGIKLKQKYVSYSAVLVSGAIAIFYFITYAAYLFYDMLPQSVAFALMFVFTAFTVVTANHYNKQVISHIGLVGAYAVPFLLSDGSGRVAVLFSYMAIINIGILVIAFKKYWKPLYYVSFAITWMIYISWFFNSYDSRQHIVLGLLFTTLTFVTFYIILLAYKLIKKELYDAVDTLLLITNSFVFYGLGYAMLENHHTGSYLLGAFTVATALVHFLAGLFIYKRQPANSTLFYIVGGLVMVFITLAIPVQLDGNWVTIIWALQAALLFWIGRTKANALFEKMSYALMLLALISLIQDWIMAYTDSSYSGISTSFKPLINSTFMTSVLVLIAFIFMNYIHNNFKTVTPLFKNTLLTNIQAYMLPVSIFILAYLPLRLEISTYFQQAYFKTMVIGSNLYSSNTYNPDLMSYGSIGVLIYTMVFLAGFSLYTRFRTKSTSVALITVALNVVTITVFLVQGLYEISELRTSYVTRASNELFHVSYWNIGIRYISLAVFAGFLYVTYIVLKAPVLELVYKKFKAVAQLAIHAISLWVLSSELLHWMDLSGIHGSYKLGISILWGCYSLLMVVLGIWKSNAWLRIGGMAVFAITLLKLFLYDIAHLNTIAKTVVFVSLGILLLIISFLYNKYKDQIHDK